MSILKDILDLACPHSLIARAKLERLANILTRGGSGGHLGAVPGSLAQVGDDDGALVVLHGACCFKRVHLFGTRDPDGVLIKRVEGLRKPAPPHDPQNLDELDQGKILRWVNATSVAWFSDAHEDSLFHNERFACVHVLPSISCEGGPALYATLRFFWPLLTIGGAVILHRQDIMDRANDPCWEVLREEDVATAAREKQGLIVVRKSAGLRLKSARNQDAAKG